MIQSAPIRALAYAALLGAVSLFVTTQLLVGRPTTGNGKEPKDSPRTRPTSKPKAPEAPTARPMIQETLATVDREIAERMVKRQDAATAALEAEIDLRIVTRWFLEFALTLKNDSDAQAASYVRGLNMIELTAAFEPILAQPLSKEQSDALRQVHELTYNFPQVKEVKEVDAFCRKLAGPLALAGGAQVNTRTLVSAMRPTSRPSRQPATATREAPNRIAGLVKIDQELQAATVSPPLLKQLRLLLTGATIAEKDKTAGAGEMQRQLQSVMEITRALETNTAVSAESRTRIETELAESLALYNDPRTRSAGQQRLEGLNQYRSLAGRLAKMNLTPAQHRQLSPLLAWAQQNGEAGAKVVSAVERFTAERARFDARPRAATAITNLRKPMDDLQKKFEQASIAFLTAAGELPQAGESAEPATLVRPSQDMARIAEALALLDQMPQTMKILMDYKPRPLGGLERRVGDAATQIAGDDGGAQSAGAAYLGRANRLAQLAEQLAAMRIEIPPPADLAFTGGQVAAFHAKWKALISDLASQAAGGFEMDQGKLARLQAVPDMLEAVNEAAQVEATLDNSAELTRWADWKIPPDQLKMLFEPYKLAVKDAFDGHIADTPDALAAWTATSKRYRPFLKLIQETSLYRDQCQKFPEGAQGAISTLLTPMDGAGFPTQRYATMGLNMWMRVHILGEDEAAEAVLTVVSRRIAADLKLD